MAIVRDEEREARLAEYARPLANGAVGEAVSAVLASSGEPGAGCDATGTWMDEEELRRIFDRAGIYREPVDMHHLACRDRRGGVHLPLDAAVEIAQAFAAAEPTTVTSYVEDEEETLRERGAVPGDRWYRQYLREKGPAHALVRQWAGPQQEAEELRKEIGRLRGIISRATYELRAAGDERGARRLERALRGG
jgi:hypothetical protein